MQLNSLLRSLGKEIGIDDGISGEDHTPRPEDGGTVWAMLVGKKIAIYSLQESTLRRTANILRELCPEVRVDTFHDHVGEHRHFERRPPLPMLRRRNWSGETRSNGVH